MKCTDRDVNLSDGPAGTALLALSWIPCGVDAVFRVSVPADPWPLQYACVRHVASTVLALGGDCRVTQLTTRAHALPAARGLGEHGEVQRDPEKT